MAIVLTFLDRTFMALVVDQLIYTSFPKIGFKHLASANIPVAIQQIFYQQIVSQFWDAYNPPQKNSQGAYLYQVTSRQTLFGWLDNDEMDEFGRSHIPYFHCYYLTEPLNTARLDQILACLEAGLVTRIERQNPPKNLPLCTIPDIYPDRANHSGVKIPANIRQRSHRKLQQKELIQWFVPVPPTTMNVSANDATNSDRSSTQPVIDPSQKTDLIMNDSQLETILSEFAAKPIGIQGVILVSADGQPLTEPIGFDENTALIVAGTMIHLVRSTQEEFSWEIIEQIAIRGQDGHVVLTACTPDTFLLVKTGKAIAGWLEGETKRVVRKLQTALQVPELVEPQPQPTILPQLTPQPLPSYNLVSETEDEPDEEIRYRGRPTKG